MARLTQAVITRRVGSYEIRFFKRGDIIKGHVQKDGMFAPKWELIDGRWKKYRYGVWVKPGFYRVKTSQ